ncbi:hypothetical protein TNCV_459801 [Trichonephila clavipes]|nr:hypothetical protein TNCV_459801 [Trichonephila clavipes]
MHVNTVESSNILPLVWWDSKESWGQLKCRPPHLTMVKNDEDRYQRVAEQCDVNVHSLTQAFGQPSYWLYESWQTIYGLRPLNCARTSCLVDVSHCCSS